VKIISQRYIIGELANARHKREARICQEPQLIILKHAKPGHDGMPTDPFPILSTSSAYSVVVGIVVVRIVGSEPFVVFELFGSKLDRGGVARIVWRDGVVDCLFGQLHH
jgi:hypothetical protein